MVFFSLCHKAKTGAGSEAGTFPQPLLDPKFWLNPGWVQNARQKLCSICVTLSRVCAADTAHLRQCVPLGVLEVQVL